MSRTVGCLLAVYFALVIGLAGCTPTVETPRSAKPEAELDKKSPGKTVPAQTVSRQKRAKAFKDAVLRDPPVDFLKRPPDRTVAGKNVATIYEAIAGDGGLWEQVELSDAQGRPLSYTAILKTELGEIHIALAVDAAPNHVTSFIALARAGYFDGLPFHASHRTEMADKKVAYLESGCPLGTGEFGYGSVGYWLEPEIKKDMVHERGSVGAWHFPDQPDTAACRFYVALTPLPWMDGGYTIFGRVTRGLEVADAINRRPNVDDDSQDRPREPVSIQEVIIRAD
jgi:cyclophilin family peptidyl-prolyl cis-trans isomerase